MDIFKILIFSKSRTQDIFPFIYISSLFPLSVLQFPMQKSFTSLVKFISIYFLLYNTIVNVIVFKISFSGNLLLVYRKTNDFCVLILYSPILLNQFFTSHSFLVGSFGISLYKIMSFANRDNLTSSFFVWMSFIFFLAQLLWLGFLVLC